MTTIATTGIEESTTFEFRPAGSAAGLADLRSLVNIAIDVLGDELLVRGGPVLPGGPAAVALAARAALDGPLLAEEPVPAEDAFRELITAYTRWSVDLTHPAAVARMQCPPAAVAVGAELVAATLNQSLHAWESGPFALKLERYVVAELAGLVGYGADAGGTLTAGGSISNLMAVLAARDNVIPSVLGHESFTKGLATLAVRPVVLCSDATHFSIGRALGITGIGEDAVLRAPADAKGRLIPAELDRMLHTLPPDTLPIAIIACAGSTDEGWVDPLRELSEVARRHGVWLHADAAYGGGALLSPRLRGMLDGLSLADSVTMDLHKFGWTPASSGIFLVRDAATLTPLARQATTLNAPDDKQAGYFGLYGTSIQATRRSDALKIAVTFRTLGRAGLAAMVDRCHELALHAAARISAEPLLQLAAEPAISTVLFRYLPVDAGTDPDVFNGELRRRLMATGTALLARTRVAQPDGSRPVFLKLMLLNPATTPKDVDGVIDDVLRAAALPAE